MVEDAQTRQAGGAAQQHQDGNLLDKELIEAQFLLRVLSSPAAREQPGQLSVRGGTTIAVLGPGTIDS